MVHKSKRARQAIQYARLPNPRDYYTQHLPDIRPHGYWVLTRCPLHKDKNRNLIVNLLHGAFRCFGCGINGPTVAHMHRHLKNLSLEEAAQDLGAWGEAV